MTITYLTPLSTCIYQVDSCKAIGIDSHECNVSTYLECLHSAVVVVVAVEILAVIYISSDQEGWEYGHLFENHEAMNVIFENVVF